MRRRRNARSGGNTPPYDSDVSDEPAPLIDRERIRKQHEERKQEFRLHPERAKILQRATVRIVQNYRKEARTASFTFASDEHAPVGDGTAPSPLQYFVAAVGL